MKKNYRTLLYSTIGVLAMAIVLIGFNVVSAAAKKRVDLTKERAYTLSPGTKTILRKLDTPVKVRLYCTQTENSTAETVYLRGYARRVEDLLAESKQVAGSKPVVGIMSPLPVFGMPANPMMQRMGQQGQGQEPWVRVNELKIDFNVQRITMDVDKIEDAVKVLLVIHPREISEKAQYAIDQFI